MNAAAATAAIELLTILQRAEANLARGEMAEADEAMQAGSDLCRRLQAAGITMPPEQLTALRELNDRCGVALARLGEQLDADSLKGDNVRRGIASYQSTGAR